MNTVVKRVNNTLPALLKGTRIKKSSAFIEDVRSQDNFLQNSLLKLSSLDAFRLYQANEWVLSTINRRCSDCVKVKPKIIPIDTSQDLRPATEKRIKIVKKFLKNPNNNKETFRQMRYKFLKDLQIYGHAAYEKVNDTEDINLRGTNQILELHNLQAANIEINADKFGNLAEFKTYKLSVGNMLSSHAAEESVFDKNEVIFAVLDPVVGSLYGLKPLDTLANSVAADILRASYNGNFFVNGSEASGILSIEDGKRTDVKKVEEAWRCKFGGAQNAHKMAVINKKINWVRMALTNQDMQFQEYGIELRDKIFAVFGMQAVMFGLSSAAPGQIKNKDEAVSCYKEGSLRPLLDLEAESYTREIIQDGFGFNDIKISFEELDKLDLVVQSEIDERDLRNTVITVNEVRKSRNMAPVKWGESPVIVQPGGAQIDPDTGRLVPPREQGAANNSKPIANTKIFHGVLGTAELNKFNNTVKNYCEFLIERKVKIDFTNVKKVFKCFEVYYESNFRTLVEKSICWKVCSSVEHLFLTKTLGNKKIFKHHFDRITEGVCDSPLYKDLEDYEAVYN